jgi:Xaa-Pro aminopeptidase
MMFSARFQSFAVAPRPPVASHVAALRAELRQRGLGGFVVPRADRHQNEYVPASEERLAWLTGFTGSAGMAVVLADRAALFVDGRYTLQAREEVDATVFDLEHSGQTTPESWIETHLAAARLGYDPWLHTVEGAEKLARAATAAGGTLEAVEPNLIDLIWSDRPAPPCGAVVLHDARYAGEAAAEKLGRIRGELDQAKADALILSDPHAVAWTFNIRGADVAHTPLPLGFALLPREGPALLYVDGRKLSNAVRDALEALAQVREPEALMGDLAALGRAQATVRLDPASTAEALLERWPDALAPLTVVGRLVGGDGVNVLEGRAGRPLPAPRTLSRHWR